MMSSEEDLDPSLESNKAVLKGTKTKRVRQRVDAGEPRNSYASIPNFSSRPPISQSQHSPGSISLSSYPSNGFANKMLFYDENKMHPMMILDSSERANGGLNGTSPTSARLYLNGGNSAACDLSALYRGMPPDSPPTPERSSSNGSSVSSNSSHLLRDILQQGRKLRGDFNSASSPTLLAKGNSGTSAGHGPSETGGERDEGGGEPAMLGGSSRVAAQENNLPLDEGDSSGESKAGCCRIMSESVATRTPPAAGLVGNSCEENAELGTSPSSSPGRSCCSPRSSTATPNSINATTWQSSLPASLQNNSNPIASTAVVANSCSTDLEVKRARVETIVNNMLQGPPRSHGPGSALGDQPTSVNGCKKRKLYQPQQHEINSCVKNNNTDILNGDTETYEDDDYDNDEPLPKRRTTDLLVLQHQLRQMQQQLIAMQQQCMEMKNADSAEEDEDMPESPHSQGQLSSNRHSSLPNRDHIRSPDSDCEDQKPRLSDVNKENNAVNENCQSKSYMDYNSLCEDQRQRTDHHRDKLSSSSHNEQSACDNQLKNSLQEIRQSCIVQPPTYIGSNLDHEFLTESLKSELSATVKQVVDEVMARFLPRKNNSKLSSNDQESSKDPTLLSQMLDRKSPRTKVIDRGTRVNGHGGALCGLRTSPYPPDIGTAPKPPFFFPLKPPTSIAPATAAFLYGSPPQMPSLSLSQPYSPPVHSTSTPQSLSLDMPEQTEPVSLVVTPKKKRHKVTDTRLNPRGQLPLSSLRGNGYSQDSQDISPKYLSGLHSSDSLPPSHIYAHHPPPPPLVPVSLPTSVAIPNPSLSQSDLFHGFPYDTHRLPHYSVDLQEEDSLMRNSTPTSVHPLLTSHGHQRGSPDSLHYSHMKQQQDNGDVSDTGDSSATYDTSMPLISFLPLHTSTLTPMHLRKAKLMFFYARYPSSAVLKMYFPDIKFNKNNTAQLVKWFSNFREFYYIQMEKYARQAMSEGVKCSEDLKVNQDSELLRVLNLHYNRNNHIEAPENFRFVVEQTLREFYKALIAGKDSEQSWKKSIYKVIARMDDNVPEYFKSPNFLETLE